jgi:ceramide glucosyltransferase
MPLLASWLLVCTGALGLAILAVQLGAVALHLRRPPPRGRARPGISILKPLCGLDDDLAENLARFAELPYPELEILLGVRSVRDPAWPLACAAARRWPGRVRAILQRGEPGLNPKVNQLITLAAEARHEILVVSDSNTRVGEGYLDEIAALFADPAVGLVTHPVVGAGAERLGSLCDALHLGASVGAGMIGAKRVASKDLVVGKSMALRRADLAALGGFEWVRDHLAEDYVIGKGVPDRLGKRVVVARVPVQNVSRRRSLLDFYRRYRRWSVIHRFAVGRLVYAGELVLNPTALALAALALEPGRSQAVAAAALVAARVALDGATVRLLAGRLRPAALLAVPIKDLVLAAAWWHGFLVDRVDWRGNLLRVLPGTRLDRRATRRGAPAVAAEPAPSEG